MNATTETLVTAMPDYACRDNGRITVVVTGSIRDGKVVKITVRHGHTQFRNQE